MAAHALFLSVLFMVLNPGDRPIYYFDDPSATSADEPSEYRSSPGAGALLGLVSGLAIMGGILLASLISVPSAIVLLLGKHRAAVPTVIALAIWALVWLSYVGFSNSFIAVLGLIGTIVVLGLGIKGMRNIGDMS